MANNPEIQVDVKLNDSDFQRKATGMQNDLKKTAHEFKALGRDISEVGRTLTFFGGAVTAGLGAAFAKASKDIPQVNLKLQEVSNSFQALSNNVATAAMPSLNAFSSTLSGVVAVVSDFVSTHQEMVNQFIKYSAIAVVVGTLGIAIGKLLQTMKSLIDIGLKLGKVIMGLNVEFLLIAAAVVALIAALAFLSDKFLGTNIFAKLGQSLDWIQNKFNHVMDTFERGSKESAKRMTDVWGKFAEGFKANIQTLGESVKTFGSSVSGALENSFSDAIFQTITGKIQGLRTILIGFANDVARAFSKMLANKALAALFGDKEGGKGLFSGFGAFLGLGGKSPSHDLDKNVRKTSNEFVALTHNMKLFAKAKDHSIDKLKEFSKGLSKGGGGAVGGGVGMGVDAASFTKALEPVNTLNAALAGTVGLIGSITAGFGFASDGIIKMGLTYVATQAVMVTTSIASAVAAVAIGVAAASALAKAWIKPALLASIATFGVAAAVGTAALGGAIASSSGLASLPAGAGISFGDGAKLPKMADGGIVTRPTVALIGEAGPEAVVPLSGNKGKGFGGSSVSVHVDTAVLNNPANMRQFVNMLKEELAR